MWGFLKRFLGDNNDKEIKRMQQTVDKINAMEADLPYLIDCPAILICGKKDQAGSAKSYNRRWANKEHLPIYWIEGAGHNSNTDKPSEVNRIIREFIKKLPEVSS